MAAETIWWVEFIGYLASIIVAISITINGGIYFRFINFIGAACFLVYAALKGTIPIVLINVYSMGINLFYFVKLTRARIQVPKNTSNEEASSEG